MAYRQRRDLIATTLEERIQLNQEGTGVPLDQSCKGSVDFTGAVGG
jgi:hypothetical protein